MKIRKETERANYILDTLDRIYPTGILASFTVRVQRKWVILHNDGYVRKSMHKTCVNWQHTNAEPLR